MMTGVTAILGGDLGGGGGISGVNTLRTGGSDYANVTDSATLQFSTAMTISAYVNIDTTGGKQTIISKDDGGSDGYELYYDTTAGKFKGHIYIGAAIKEVESAITPLAGVWYNVALWHDGTNLKLYVDGVQSGITPASGSIDTNTAVFRIGASSTTVATNVLNGSIALVMGWNDDLTPAELTEIVTPKDPSLYSQQASMQIGLPLNGGSENPATDTTGNNNNAVLINGADYTGVKLTIEQSSGGGPVEAQYNTFGFDGTDDYIAIANDASWVPNTGDISFSIWFKTTSASGWIMHAQGTSVTRDTLELYIDGNGHLACRLFSSSGGQWIERVATDYRDGNWHQATINLGNINHSTAKIYVDGVEKTTVDTGSDISASNPTSELRIGERVNNDLQFQGDLAGFWLERGSISASDAANFYQSGKTAYYETLPSSLTTNAKIYLEMSSRDNTLDDKTGNGNNGTANGGVTDNGSLQTFTPYT
jgi:hypothetical protein